MARPTFQTLPGTRDLLPPDTDRFRALVGVFADEAARSGFSQIVPPIFEEIGVFTRLGEATDVVTKELYAFEDMGGRKQALRPEFTASVCRAFVQHRPLLPWKSWYAGPAFRQERPQKGRYRQFEQVGAEAIGSHDPDLDTELIVLAARFYQRLGLKDITLVLNTLGDKADRPAFLEALRDYFGQNLDALSQKSRETLSLNPLRVLDSKRPDDQPLIESAPRITDYLSSGAGLAFERVQAGLEALGVAYELNPRLVRGLDYYTRTTFEFLSSSLDAAQNAVGGGGRYDGLVADMGGPDEPGVGFALGVDRTVLACDSEGVFAAPDTRTQIFVVSTTGGLEGLKIAEELRSAGLRVDRAVDHRSMKAQMKAANRSRASLAVIVGPDEVAAGTASLRPLDDRPQFVVERTELVSRVKEFFPS